MSDHDFDPFDDPLLPYDETPAPDDTPLYDHDDHELWSQDGEPPAYDGEPSGHDAESAAYDPDSAARGHDLWDQENAPGQHGEPFDHDISEMSGRGQAGEAGAEHGDAGALPGGEHGAEFGREHGAEFEREHGAELAADEHHAGESDGWDDPGHTAWDDPEAAAADHVDVFPPALDVGELPEPVDGFPWIDTGSLGVDEPGPVVEHLDPVRPEELAAYAGEELPPGQDPWAVLADSDDPATSALARWWNDH